MTATLYTVIYINIFQRDQADDSQLIKPESDNLAQGNSQHQENGDLLETLKQLNDTCTYLYNHLETVTDHITGRFRQVAANTRYYHSLLVDEIERLNQTGVKVVVDGKGQEQLLKKLRDFQQEATDREYRSTCYSMLFNKDNWWDYASSSFLIVLPVDLNTWDDSDSSTHKLRLHYLCDNWIEGSARKDLPQHVHLCNQPGYNIKRQQEFFQTYGDYVLRVLQMIKRGYSKHNYEIPPLETFKILWDCDPNVVGSHITNDTIGPLIDKAIVYLQEISPPKWKGKLGLTQIQSFMIKTHLDVQDSDHAESYLHRYLDKQQYVFWKCKAHAHQYLNKESEELETFVCGHGGYIDMQQATLGVELRSSAKADQFRSLLAGSNYTFDMSIKLGWEAARSYVKRLCNDIANTGTVVLELDGIRFEQLDIVPLCYGQSQLLINEIKKPNKARFIRLLNYPRPQEQCILLNKFSLQSVNLTAQIPHSWMRLDDDLEALGNLVDEAQDSSGWDEVVKALQSTLDKYGLAGTTVTTICNDEWNAVFDQASGALIEVHSEHRVFPEGLLTAGTIKILEVQVRSLQFEEEFFQAVRANDSLQELTVSYLGHNMLYYTAHLANMWSASAHPIHLTLLDLLEDTGHRVVAQLSLSGSDSQSLGKSILNRDGFNTGSPISQQDMDVPLYIAFQKWDCDHVFSALSDYSASFLDMATKQHPLVLTIFTLDVSQLSQVGLSSIQEVFGRSNLEQLQVVCTPVDSLSQSITQVLGFVQWNTLKSLTLSGDDIDEWCQLWPSSVSPRLLSLQVNGSSSVIQELSHSSVLFLQHLIFSSPLVELHLKNVQLQDKRDWALLVDTVDLTSLQTLDLGEHGFRQLLSVPHAIDLLVSGLEATNLGSQSPKLILPSFMLDIVTLSQPSLMHVQRIFSHYRLVELVVQCDSIDLSVSGPVTKVVSSVHWPLLERLILSGNNINQWIQLLAKINAPRLKTLQIFGRKSVPQELSHASVLFVERLISTSSLMELYFKDVLLHDQGDWERLVEKMDPSTLDDFGLGDGSFEQFMATPDAVDLEHSKRTEWKQKRRDITEE
ncbi:hypothetical protein BG000_011429 [Podila horticola]|nr:hypothetical protein BG000_011429 [Podila horticola]